MTARSPSPGSSAAPAVFDAWAEYYDLIHGGLPGDVAFYVARAAEAGGVVLEVGVGTGRIALPTALAGVAVTGLDNSPAMLAICRAKRQAAGLDDSRLRLVQADMRDFDLGRRFPLVTVPYRAFMHLLEPEDQQRCLMTLREHLRDDGRLILDTWVPRLSALESFLGRPGADVPRLCEEYLLDGGCVTLRHYNRTSCDEPRQLLSEESILVEADVQGAALRAVSVPLVRRWTTVRELGHLVRSCGFRTEAVYGDFDGGPLTADSVEMVWVLRKDRNEPSHAT